METRGNLDIEISTIAFDSRKVESNCIFVAVKGARFDGNHFIDDALGKGAKVIVSEEQHDVPVTSTFIKVRKAGQALGVMASNYYEKPSSKLKLVGITGTNGKTSVATLLYKTFIQLGYKVGLLSTIQNVINGKETATTHTTPDAIKLNEVLDEAVRSGCEFCFMEVSSHAIDQDRIEGLTFSGGIFTNITHDHLDYHGTFDAYIKAKKKFFDHLPADAFALVNKDDRNGKIMVQNSSARKYTFALKSFSNFKAKVIESHFDGTLLHLDNKEVWTHFAGFFNAYNLLAVYACAILLGQEQEEVLTVISNLKPVRGRFECICSGDGRIAIVDYAHTPDALLNVLQTINQLRGGNGKLITVVGAGGNRDKSKRPIMAKLAVENSDKVIFTSDNPRDEEPGEILNQMQDGVPLEFARKATRVNDRKEAIKIACMMAENSDIILVAGKGHETYQEIKGQKYPFDDREIIKEQFLIHP